MVFVKSRLLKLLRENDVIHSGQQLSDRLGVSRVSVWKQIKALESVGYVVETTPNGYRLAEAPDIPYPWEFPRWETQIHYLPSVASTMEKARELAQKGCPEMSVVVADCQTLGRGRLQRQWISNKGGLYFTLVLRPNIELSNIARVNFQVAAMVTRLLRTHYNVNAGTKWPNDILVDGKKVCGMLSEVSAEGDVTAYINIGIGVNLNNTPPSDLVEATSIKALVGHSVVRNQFLGAFLEALEAQVKQGDWDDTFTEWKRYAVNFNRRVTVHTLRETITGMALDVDASGALMVKKENGEVVAIAFGDCFLDGP